MVVVAPPIYVPPLRDLFGMATPPPAAYLVVFPFPVIVWGVDELRRLRIRQAAKIHQPAAA